MDARYHMRRMRPEELNEIMAWAAQEGWNPGRYDATTFYAADPDGFWVGELDGELIAAASLVHYGRDHAFAGLYIVKKPFRGQGYGMALTQHCMTLATKANVGLDGVLENVALYARIGFHYYFKNHRFEFTAQEPDSLDPHIVPLNNVPSEQLMTYDQQCFPAPRQVFLTAWINQPEVTAIGYLNDQRLLGYAVCRRCIQGYKIGPLFADNRTIAEKLLHALQQHKSGELLYLDVPEINPEAMSLATQFDMRPVFATARMYNQGLPKLAYPKIYGITSFELG